MSGFHLCPLNHAARGLVRGKYLAQDKQRIPIGQRAQQLLDSTGVSLAEVKWFCDNFSGGEKSFKIGNKTCYIRSGPEPPVDLMSSLIFHLAAALEGESFMLIVNREANPFEVIRCNLYSPAHKNSKADHELAFYIYRDFGKMELEFIRSKGRGGKLMAALYNLARSHNLERIEFTVVYNNIAAQNFYFHIDAGHPIDANNWVLPVPRKK